MNKDEKYYTITELAKQLDMPRVTLSLYIRTEAEMQALIDRLPNGGYNRYKLVYSLSKTKKILKKILKERLSRRGNKSKKEYA